MAVIYQIAYLEAVTRKHIPNLPVSMKVRIKRAIEERLTVDPVVFGKPLRHSLKGHRRLRVGDYRIVYRIEEEPACVLIVAIEHRKDVYEA